jgi:teichoic acid transport system permease protein
MKKKIFWLCAVLVIIAFNIVCFVGHPDWTQETMTLAITLKADTTENTQVFYLRKGDSLDDIRYNADNATKLIAYTDASGKYMTLKYDIPADTRAVRFDPSQALNLTTISDIKITYQNKTVVDLMKSHADIIDTHQADVSTEDGKIKIQTEGGDGYITFSVPASYSSVISKVKSYGTVPARIKRLIAAAAVDLIFLLIILKRKSIFSIPRDLWQEKRLVWNLGKNDFKARFAGSYLGIVWAFVQPIVTVVVYWFVFQKALNVGTQSTKAGIQVPYVLWLIAGLVPWFYFSDVVTSGTNVIVEYSYLVKKVVFKISCLPVVKAISSIFVHLFFLAFILIMYACYGHFPNLYMLQMLYYSFSMMVLGLAIIYFTSAVNVFFRDTAQIVNIIMQVMVWFTPIMWNIDGMTLSAPVTFIMKLNPMFYVIQGYRDALINHVWFWDHAGLTVYFWCVTVLLLIFGSWIFRRLKVHFADVL